MFVEITIITKSKQSSFPKMQSPNEPSRKQVAYDWQT